MTVGRQSFQAGGALEGYFSPSVIASWGRCTSGLPATTTYSGGKVLDAADSDSWNDPCLRLSNEVDFRDLASNDGFSKACLDASLSAKRAGSNVVPSILSTSARAAILADEEYASSRRGNVV